MFLSPNDSYKISSEEKPRTSLFLHPLDNSCQIVQVLPNISQPDSRFCIIHVEKNILIPNSIHLRYGKRRVAMSHCPYELIDGKEVYCFDTDNNRFKTE